MSVEKLKRVMQRIRARNPGRKFITRDELQRAIMLECGTHPMTYKQNRRALIVLGWISTRRKGKRIYLTNKDITEDY